MTAVGQKVEYRNDSLFVNNYFVDASTSETTLDSLLQTSGKTKVSKDKDKKNAVTNKQVKITTHFYYNLGLFFRTYDDRTTQLSVGIKLYRATDKKNYEERELTETFKGQLIIADNLINDKRQISQLQELNNCSVTITKGTVGYYSSILWGDIIYQENVIRLMFDIKTSELTTVYIHHNFKNR
jgi:hypothetical protein